MSQIITSELSGYKSEFMFVQIVGLIDPTSHLHYDHYTVLPPFVVSYGLTLHLPYPTRGILAAGQSRTCV